MLFRHKNFTVAKVPAGPPLTLILSSLGTRCPLFPTYQDLPVVRLHGALSLQAIYVMLIVYRH